jgi:uncharacterized membrane protein
MKLLSENGSSIAQRAKTPLALGLGWFSIGLGLAELLAPRALSRLIGVPCRPWMLACLGLREIATGIGILEGSSRGDWLWARVGGDMMDLGLLGAALASDESEPRRIEAAAAAVLSVTALDVLSARQHAVSEPEAGAIHFHKTITINRSPEVVYKFWRNFENLPRFMHNLVSVTSLGLGHSRWVAKAPAGQTVEWDAKILEDVPNRLISWHSLEGSDVDNAGAVRFEEAPGQRGTIVRVDITYRPPGGKFGAGLAKLFGKAPDQEVQGDLFRFKQVLETGHVMSRDGQSPGKSRSTSRLYDDTFRP